MVVGGPGAGKTTLALRLGALLDLPVIHVDALALSDNRTLPDEATLRSALVEASTAERWVIEGTTVLSRPRLRTRANLVIHLDIGRPRRLLNWLCRRLWFAGRHRPGMASGWREPWGMRNFKKPWHYERDHRQNLRDAINALGGWQRLVVITRMRDIDPLVAQLAALPGA